MGSLSALQYWIQQLKLNSKVHSTQSSLKSILHSHQLQLNSQFHYNYSNLQSNLYSNCSTLQTLQPLQLLQPLKQLQSVGVTRLCRQRETWFVLLEERSPLQQSVQTLVANFESNGLFNGVTMEAQLKWQIQYAPLFPAHSQAVPVTLTLYGGPPSPGDPIPTQ